ncbi:hypothetical protein QBC46DRAFT_409262 [Diplogelasinospora grovesii]|uniref:C2H2-type domain-containing protein n=1 Tax=Diplogelasinospora grovesii TaxID=303347 RepID=A0AAN6N549_9PEZI|nr:hypothetical protein QBC46DRAFT_409262 [Diplogelasinospora grovesii]
MSASSLLRIIPSYNQSHFVLQVTRETLSSPSYLDGLNYDLPLRRHTVDEPLESPASHLPPPGLAPDQSLFPFSEYQLDSSPSSQVAAPDAIQNGNGNWVGFHDPHGALSPQIQTVPDAGERRAGDEKGANLACPDLCCNYTTKTKRDVDRHFNAVHKKTPKFFCPVKSCKRSRKLEGWTRKDLRDRHVRTQHNFERDSPPENMEAVPGDSPSVPLETLTSVAIDGEDDGMHDSPSSPLYSLGLDEMYALYKEERRLRMKCQRDLQRLQEREELFFQIASGKFRRV